MNDQLVICMYLKSRHRYYSTVISVELLNLYIVRRCSNAWILFISPFFSPECSDFNPGKAWACKHDAGLQEGVWPRQRAAVAHHRRRWMCGRPRRLHHPVRPPAPAGIRSRHREGTYGVAPEAGTRWWGEHGFFPGGERMNFPRSRTGQPSNEARILCYRYTNATEWVFWLVREKFGTWGNAALPTQPGGISQDLFVKAVASEAFGSIYGEAQEEVRDEEEAGRIWSVWRLLWSERNGVCARSQNGWMSCVVGCWTRMDACRRSWLRQAGVEDSAGDDDDDVVG